VKPPNGGEVDAAARIHSTIAGPVMIRRSRPTIDYATPSLART